MSAPRHLLAAWPWIRPRLARPRSVALFTDFDGTLIRIARRHTGGRLRRRVRELLGGIARTGALVGVVSGRRLEDVRKRVALREIWYAGVHGFFLCGPANRRVTHLNRKDRKRIARVHRRLRRGLRGLPGIALEPKAATVAVHYRGASRRNAIVARSLVERICAGEPGLHLLEGKKIWEFFPGGAVDKWTAIEFILRRERQRNPAAGRVLIYLGDDATDERVFRRMRGISVAVGRRQRTAARYFLRSPAEVRRFLEALKESLE